MPLCLGAVCWSRIGSVYLSVNRRDAAGIEFRDELIREELAKPFDERALPVVHVPCDGALDAFAAWTRRAGAPHLLSLGGLGHGPVDGRQPLRRTGAAHVVRKRRSVSAVDASSRARRP